jgi:hypothetical protein
MKALIPVVLVLLLATSAAAQPTTITTREILAAEDVVPSFWVPCANSGVGELAVSSGVVKNVSHLTIHPDGAFTLVAQSNPQGVSLVGVSTGHTYRGTGAIQYVFRSDVPLPVVTTYVMNFGVIGPGPGNNFRLRMRMHLTIAATGLVTSNIESITADCR